MHKHIEASSVAQWRSAWDKLTRAEWLRRLSTSQSESSLPPTTTSGTAAASMVPTSPPTGTLQAAHEPRAMAAVPAPLLLLEDARGGGRAAGGPLPGVAARLHLHALCQLDVWVASSPASRGRASLTHPPPLTAVQPPGATAVREHALALVPPKARPEGTDMQTPTPGVAQAAGELLACVAAACSREDVTYLIHKSAAGSIITVVAVASTQSPVAAGSVSTLSAPKSPGALSGDPPFHPLQQFSLWKVAELHMGTHALHISKHSRPDITLSAAGSDEGSAAAAAAPPLVGSSRLSPPPLFAKQLAALCVRAADKLWQGLLKHATASGRHVATLTSHAVGDAALLRSLLLRAVHLSGHSPTEQLGSSENSIKQLPVWVRTCYLRLAQLDAQHPKAGGSVYEWGQLEASGATSVGTPLPHLGLTQKRRRAKTPKSAAAAPAAPVAGAFQPALLQSAVSWSRAWGGEGGVSMVHALQAATQACASLEGGWAQAALRGVPPPAEAGAAADAAGNSSVVSSLLVEDETAVEEAASAVGCALVALQLCLQEAAGAVKGGRGGASKVWLQRTADLHLTCARSALHLAAVCSGLHLWGDAAQACQVCWQLMPGGAGLAQAPEDAETVVVQARWAALQARGSCLSACALRGLWSQQGCEATDCAAPALAALQSGTPLTTAMHQIRCLVVSGAVLVPLQSCAAAVRSAPPPGEGSTPPSPQPHGLSCSVLQAAMSTDSQAAAVGQVRLVCMWLALQGGWLARALPSRRRGPPSTDEPPPSDPLPSDWGMALAALACSAALATAQDGGRLSAALSILRSTQEWLSALCASSAAVLQDVAYTLTCTRLPGVVEFHCRVDHVCARTVAVRIQLALAAACSQPALGGAAVRALPQYLQNAEETVPKHVMAHLQEWPLGENSDPELFRFLPRVLGEAVLRCVVCAVAGVAVRGSESFARMAPSDVLPSLVWMQPSVVQAVAPEVVNDFLELAVPGMVLQRGALLQHAAVALKPAPVVFSAAAAFAQLSPVQHGQLMEAAVGALQQACASFAALSKSESPQQPPLTVVLAVACASNIVAKCIPSIAAEVHAQLRWGLLGIAAQGAPALPGKHEEALIGVIAGTSSASRSLDELCLKHEQVGADAQLGAVVCALLSGALSAVKRLTASAAPGGAGLSVKALLRQLVTAALASNENTASSDMDTAAAVLKLGQSGLCGLGDVQISCASQCAALLAVGDAVKASS